jgi:hypothetical protein
MRRLGDLFDAPPEPAPYKRRRWCRCTACGSLIMVAVSRHARLRSRPSPCCDAPMRPREWRPTLTDVFKALTAP